MKKRHNNTDTQPGTLSLSSRLVGLLLAALMIASVGLAYANRNDETTKEAAQASQQDIDQQRQINGVNVLYYHPEIENLVDYNDAFVTRLEQLGTTDIAIAIPFFMKSNTASSVITTAETPSVEEVKLLIERAKTSGIRPTIKPLVDGLDEDFNRQGIKPGDIDAWFESYYSVLTPYIELSEQQELPWFVAGVELSSIQDYSFKWANMITDIRELYNGDITYAANWDAPNVSFASELDFIGIDAYYPYEGAIDNAKLKKFWQTIFDELPYTDDDGFIIHEYGIPSEVGAEANPWKAEGVNSVSENLQNSWIRAACDVIHQRSRGGYIWAVYFGTDLELTREDQKGYNILGKPAVENSVRDCFSWY